MKTLLFAQSRKFFCKAVEHSSTVQHVKCKEHVSRSPRFCLVYLQRDAECGAAASRRHDDNLFSNESRESECVEQLREWAQATTMRDVYRSLEMRRLRLRLADVPGKDRGEVVRPRVSLLLMALPRC